MLEILEHLEKQCLKCSYLLKNNIQIKLTGVI